MAPSDTTDSSNEPQRSNDDWVATKNAEAEANTQYGSSAIPLLWVGIPFVLVLIYGFFS